MTLALTPAEIFALTHRTVPAVQLKHLRRMGIRAERRADGSVLVLHAWLAEGPKSAAQSSPRPRLKSDEKNAAAPSVSEARLSLVR